MDGTKPKVIEKITEKKTYWTDRINKNVEVGSVNEEKEKVIERYEKVLNFLKGVHMNTADLVHIKKPLDDLESNLKYIPNGPLFNDVLPTEIKEYILNLSYSCDSKAFVAASVCQDWKGVLANRFKDKKVIIEDECDECEAFECVEPTDMLKAAAAHKLDVHLVIWQPSTEEDPKFISDALTSVSTFTVTNHHECEEEGPVLSTEQFDHLFTSIEKGDKIMEEVKLVQFDLKCLNQEILANCLVSKIKRLTLDQQYYDDRMLDVGTFLNKLLQDSNSLTHLTLIDFTFNEDFKSQPALSSLVASALVNVENVKLCGYTDVPMEQLLENLLKTLQTNKRAMKTLIIDMEDYLKRSFYDFVSLIDPQDLKTLFNEMATFQLEGIFTLEQQEAVSSLPDVEVGRMHFSNSEDIYQYIKKGSTEIF